MGTIRVAAVKRLEFKDVIYQPDDRFDIEMKWCLGGLIRCILSDTGEEVELKDDRLLDHDIVPDLLSINLKGMPLNRYRIHLDGIATDTIIRIELAKYAVETYRIRYPDEIREVTAVLEPEPKVKRWCCRVCVLESDVANVVPASFLLLLHKMGLVRSNITNPSGQVPQCFDLLAPLDIPNDQSKAWSESIGVLGMSFGYNAVAAPEDTDA